MQVKFHQLLYQALKKQGTKAQVHVCFVCFGCHSNWKQLSFVNETYRGKYREHNHVHGLSS